MSSIKKKSCVNISVLSLGMDESCEGRGTDGYEVSGGFYRCIGGFYRCIEDFSKKKKIFLCVPMSKKKLKKR